MMRKTVATFAAAALLALAGCSADSGSDSTSAGNGNDGPPPLEQKESYTIGFAGQQADHPWTLAFNESIQSEVEARGHRFVYTDAQGSTARQVENVESLIAQQVDVIIITPREERPLAEAVLKAKEAGIPVFVADRAVDDEVAVAGEDYVAYIGSDFFEEGRMAGAWVNEFLDGSGTVIELAGTTGSSAADDRGGGFREAIEGTDIEIVASQDGDMIRDKGRQNMETLIQQYPDVDVVFAHNDEMGLGAITALEAAGYRPGEDVAVISIDGQKEALQAIIDGKLNATVECNPRFGPAVLDAIEAYGRGETVEPFVVNEDKFFDASNAAAEIDNAF